MKSEAVAYYRKQAADRLRPGRRAVNPEERDEQINVARLQMLAANEDWLAVRG